MNYSIILILPLLLTVIKIEGKCFFFKATLNVNEEIQIIKGKPCKEYILKAIFKDLWMVKFSLPHWWDLWNSLPLDVLDTIIRWYSPLNQLLDAQTCSNNNIFFLLIPTRSITSVFAQYALANNFHFLPHTHNFAAS